MKSKYHQLHRWLPFAIAWGFVGLLGIFLQTAYRPTYVSGRGASATSRKPISTHVLSPLMAVGAAPWDQRFPASDATFAEIAPVTRTRLLDAYGRLPLSFEANQGQTDAQVRFLSRGNGYTLFLTGTEAVLSLRSAAPVEPNSYLWPRPSAKADLTRELWLQDHSQQESQATVLLIQLVSPNPEAKILGADELPGKSNYFIGNDPKKWRTDVPTYAKVKYHEVYPGVDLVYYGNQGRLEYDFEIAPGADPKKISLAIAGATNATPTGREPEGGSFLSIDPNGDLVVATKGGEVRYQKPVAFQRATNSGPGPADAKAKHFVEARYILKSENQVGFEVASYNAAKPLIIDPVLLYATYLAGGLNDQGLAIAVDSLGSAYITGLTNSTDFPTTMGAFKRTCGTDSTCDGAGAGNSNTDVFVTKLNAAGSALVYSTYLGGSLRDLGNAIAVDSSGNAYVTGSTNSLDFPVTSGAFQTSCGPVVGRDNFSCAIVQRNTCGVAGGQILDAFVTKLNPTGSTLVYSTFLGGTSHDSGNAIAVNAAGEAYIAGQTLSQQSINSCPGNPSLNNENFGYPTTPGGFLAAPAPSGTPFPAFQPSAFFSKLKADGSGLVYSTYLGAAGPFLTQLAAGVAIDSSGNAYVTGATNSSPFPTTPGVIQPAIAGSLTLPGQCGSGLCADAFVAKFDPSKSGAASLVYSTYLGGSGSEAGFAIAADSSGNAYVTGQTGSVFNAPPSVDFPVTAGAFQTTCPGTCNVGYGFVTKLNPTASARV